METTHDKVLVVKVSICLRAGDEDGEVLGQGNQGAECKSAIAAPQAEWRSVLEQRAIIGYTLRSSGLDEVNVGDENGTPGQESEDGHEIDKVAKDCLGRCRDVHVCDAADCSRQTQSIKGNSLFVGSGKDFGRMLLDGQSVECSRGNVQIRVGGAEDEDQNASIENGRQGGNTSQFDGGNERRGSGGGGGLGGQGQLRAVVWNNHAQEQDREDVEDTDTPEGQLDGTRDVAAWVLRLSDCDTDQFRSEVGKDGSDHTLPYGSESTRCSLKLVGFERAGVAPVLETSDITIDASACHDQTEEDESENDNDLDGRKPELQLAEVLDAEKVNGHDDDEEDGDPDTRIHSFGRDPVLNDQCSSSQLIGSGDDVFEPIRVSQRETKGRVDESVGINGETTSSGEPGGHLAQSSHDHVDEETDDGVGDENGGGTGVGQRCSRSDNETRTTAIDSWLVSPS